MASFETFVPMKKKSFEKNGKEFTKVVPAVSNLCFVNAEKGDLDKFLQDLGAECYARYVWDKATAKPAVIPQQAIDRKSVV